jgi:hypothetical protein
MVFLRLWLDIFLQWDSAWGKGRWRVRAPHELVFQWVGSFDAERCFRPASRLGLGRKRSAGRATLTMIFAGSTTSRVGLLESAGQLYTRATRKHRSGYVWQGRLNLRMLGSRSD